MSLYLDEKLSILLLAFVFVTGTIFHPVLFGNVQYSILEIRDEIKIVELEKQVADLSAISQSLERETIRQEKKITELKAGIPDNSWIGWAIFLSVVMVCVTYVYTRPESKKKKTSPHEKKVGVGEK